jgi:tRNA A37 threonylcarbamoyladenosine dehydratase
MSETTLFHRSELLIGSAAMARLAGARVILFGIGGVGSWCAEALIRSGIGHLTIVDSDCVCITNVNRQLQALPGNVGRPKVDELAERLRSIHPAAEIVPIRRAYDLETRASFAIESYDYVLDAIDSLSCKLGLIRYSLELGRTLFSSMGAAAKLDPSQVRIGSIWESEHCPLARCLRKRLRRHGVTADFTVVYSPEVLPNRGESTGCGTERCFCPRFVRTDGGEVEEAHEWCSQKAHINGSMVAVTATFGMCLASLVVSHAVAAAEAGAPTLRRADV